MALEVTRAQQVLVRAPRWASEDGIERFVTSHTSWIDRQLNRIQEYNASHPEPTKEQAVRYQQEATLYLPERVQYYGQQMNLFPTAVTITGAKTRFGSCSRQNRICFSWRLMSYPKEAIDYVVVHELAHLTHKNHGPQFYALIAEILPDWKMRRQLLR